MSQGAGTQSDPACDMILMPPDEGPPKASTKGALLVVAIMFGWLLVVLGATSVVARNDPNIEVPIEIGLGVVVMPADGWYSAADEWDVGESGVALQKNGVYVAVWVDEYQGTTKGLLSAWLDLIGPSFHSFRALPTQEISMAGGLPGLMVRFSGISEWGYEENLLAVLSHEGRGVVFMVEALAGRLSWAEGDIEEMLRTIEVPQ